MIRCSILHLDKTYISYYADQIRRYNVTYLHGYPSALYLLARCIKESGILFPRIKGLLLASEMIYEWQLDVLRDVFPEARIFAHYGCAERTVLAGWCEYQKVYHVLPQYSLVEIDPETNEVIGTNLFNIVNGFIRYRMTDVVLEPSWDRCRDCQRPYLPRFKTVGGRMGDFLYSRERGWIAPAIVTYPFKGLKAIIETQISQSTPEEIIIRFVAKAGMPDEVIERDQKHICEGMVHLLGKDMKLRFVRVDAIPKDETRKFKWIVSDLAQPHYED